jgi:hypothetical protein
MIIIKDKPKQQVLNEMAQFKAAGIVVEVRSKDHGILGNPSQPAHAHVFDNSGRKELAEIILTKKPPQKADDILYYRTGKIADGLSKAIVKFAGMPNTKSQKAGLNLTNWQAIIAQWVFFHGE